MTDEQPLLEVRPSWANFWLHLLFFWLIVPLLVAIWKRRALVLRVYPDRLVLQTGVLSRNLTDIFIADVRAIDVTQTMFQRILGVGNITISTAAEIGGEELAYGLPDPIRIRDLILTQRRALTAK